MNNQSNGIVYDRDTTNRAYELLQEATKEFQNVNYDIQKALGHLASVQNRQKIQELQKAIGDLKPNTYVNETGEILDVTLDALGNSIDMMEKYSNQNPGSGPDSNHQYTYNIDPNREEPQPPTAPSPPSGPSQADPYYREEPQPPTEPSPPSGPNDPNATQTGPNGEMPPTAPTAPTAPTVAQQPYSANDKNARNRTLGVVAAGGVGVAGIVGGTAALIHHNKKQEEEEQREIDEAEAFDEYVNAEY